MKVRVQTKWIAALIVLVAASGALLPRTKPRLSFPVPVPNGYDDFLRAGEVIAAIQDDPRIRRIHYEPFQNASEADLQYWISQGAEAVSMVRVGLTKACAVPVEATREYENVLNRSNGRLKALTWFLLAQARLAVVQGRTNDALAVYLEAYRFTRLIGAKGLAIHFVHSISCEHLAVRDLIPLIASLDGKQCAEVIDLVDVIERGQEPLSVVIRRTDQWSNATFGSSFMRKAKLERWKTVSREVWESRSLAPLDKLPSRILQRRAQAHERMMEDLRERLQKRPEQRNILEESERTP